jgi:hypothetical protein
MAEVTAEARFGISRHRLPPLHVAGLRMSLAIANVWFLSWTVAEMVLTYSAADWSVIARAARLAGTPELYELSGTSTFMWSPLAAYLMQLIVPLGLTAWRLVHFAWALAMPTWRLRLLVLVSWPFWLDVSTGNFLTLIFLTAVWALRGSRLGTFAFFALALLIPRPLLVPLGLWILWRRPEWRIPVAVMVVGNGALVLASGLGATWLMSVLAVSSELQSFLFHVSPSRWIGNAWLLVGLPLGAWLPSKGRIGRSGLALSPYVWPYYLFFGLLGPTPQSGKNTPKMA